MVKITGERNRSLRQSHDARKAAEQTYSAQPVQPQVRHGSPPPTQGTVPRHQYQPVQQQYAQVPQAPAQQAPVPRAQQVPAPQAPRAAKRARGHGSKRNTRAYVQHRAKNVQFNVRLPSALHARVTTFADKNGLPLNAVGIAALAHYVGG